MLIGSKAFRHLWEDWRRDYQPLQVLSLLLDYIQMPEDLSGELEETFYLILTLIWRHMIPSGRMSSNW